MKFDYVIGNPPYQDSSVGDNTTYQPPVYHQFMDASFKVADKVMLITPARFLFNAGSTPKEWNRERLNDKNFKVLKYFEDSRDIFNKVSIAGGIAITYRDINREFGKINIFITNQKMRDVRQKVVGNSSFKSFSNIVITRTAYRLTDKLHNDFPNAINQLSNGHKYDMSTNIFDRLPEVFFDIKPENNVEYAMILGRQNKERVYKYIKREYINDVLNFNSYKVFMPKAGGDGSFGDCVPPMEIGVPNEGNTETFISIGSFDTLKDAENCMKYIKTKFFRSLLSLYKMTQDVTPEKFIDIPLQDFTSNSDIDWEKSIKEIDKQLYSKYNFTEEEITFIETNVKEME